MSPPLLSVAMSVYNNAEHVGAAIESILGQSFSEFEFLILNDGSNDKSGDIIQSYAAIDKRIVIVNRENKGLVVSLNELIKMSRAPCVARMDGDDIALPERFARQMAFLKQNPAHGICGTWVTLIDENGHPLGEQGGEKPVVHDEFVANLEGPLFSHPTVIFRRDLVLTAGCYRAAFRHCEDYDLWLRLSVLTRMANLCERLLLYRVYSGQVSHCHKVEQCVNAAVAYIIHMADPYGVSDLCNGWARIPPLDELDRTLKVKGAAAKVRARIIAKLCHDPHALANEGYELLRQNIKDSSCDRSQTWRIAARLLRHGYPIKAASIAAALLKTGMS